MKNIPIPSREAYIKEYIDSCDRFSQRCRWKICHFDRSNDRNNDNSDKIPNYGFPSVATPPAHSALTAFENDVFGLAYKFEFTSYRSAFQIKLALDAKEIRASSCVFVPADKTTNVYKLPTELHDKLLTESVTTNYKIAPRNTKHKIDLDAKKIAKSLKIDDRVECLAERPAFITLKDHKENFANNP